MNEVVKYSNELNKVSFNTLNENQTNVLFTILAKMRHEHTKDGLKIPTKELFELADISDGGGHRSKLLKSLGVLQNFKFQYSYTHGNDKEALAQEIIFPLLKIFREGEDEFLSVKVSEVFRERYLKAMPKFTRFELEEFVNLSGTYTKTIYRFLKQFRSKGHWYVNYKEFKVLLGIPDSYRARDIDKQILNPTIKELSSELTLFNQKRIPFEKLSVEKIKDGRKIQALHFAFTPQPTTMLKKDEQKCEKSLNTKAREKKAYDEYIGKIVTYGNNSKDLFYIEEVKKNTIREDYELMALVRDYDCIAKTTSNDTSRLDFINTDHLEALILKAKNIIELKKGNTEKYKKNNNANVANIVSRAFNNGLNQ